MRRFGFLPLLAVLACFAFVGSAPAAKAAPLPYCNAPLDTMQALINSCVIGPLNSTLGGLQILQTATSSGGAVTINGTRGLITTEALTTAAGATFTETLTNSSIAANSLVMVTMGNGTSTTGTPVVTTITPAAGSVVIVIQNIHATAALNGTLKIGFSVSN